MKNRRSIRLKEYDYSQNGLYFVTLCTQNHKCLFGKIIGCKMILNKAGQLIKKYWYIIPQKYTCVNLGHVVIMPNHLHGIIGINTNYLQGGETSFLHSNPTLGNIIGWYKYKTTVQLNVKRKTPGQKLWQRNYYEHIILGDKEQSQIIRYIIDNPSQWIADRNYSKHI